MKNISIITGSDLRMVMGVNYFIKSFIQCNEQFKEVKLNRVYSGVQSLDIEKGDEMPIGSDLGSTEYNVRRGVRSFFRWILTDKFYPFALFRYEMNLRRVSKRDVGSFLSDKAGCDYIIFQELGVAEYYFKHCSNYPKTKNIKTMLIIHSEDDSGSMLLEMFEGYGGKDMQKRFNKMRDFVYSHIDNVMYISRKAYEHSIMPEGKKAFVYNGSPDINYISSDKKEKIKQFVCVGSIEGRKGQDKILEAMSLMDEGHLQKMHVTFVGGGSKEDETKALAADWGLGKYVTFTGRRNDVPEVLKTMDVFIMPSTVEGLPMSAIEAMRAGLYLILTDTGGNAELCEEGCGTVCTRDPQNIKSVIYSILDGDIISENQRLNSYMRFQKNFSLKSMAEGYQKVLLSL